MPILTLQPNGTDGKDASIESVAQANNNFQTDPRFVCGTYILTNGNARALAEFDLSSIPTGSVINSATITLTCENYYTTITVYIHRITASWLENTVTYNNQPAHDATADASLSVSSVGAKDFSVTALVQEWIDGTANYGFKIIGSSEGTSSLTGSNFDSSDFGTAGSRPKIVIDYTPPSNFFLMF